MPQTIKLHLKTSLFHKEKQLLITPEYIEFDNTNFSKFDIAEIRYGVKAIKGSHFVIGRTYCIDIKSLAGQVTSIKLVSLYRIRRNLLWKKYKKIVEALLDNFINDLVATSTRDFNNGRDFMLLGNVFMQEGVLLHNSNDIIPWEDLGTKNYYQYYSLFSKANPNKYASFYYLTDWNTVQLLMVSREILIAKNLM
jgi:hypothetical protein